MKSLFILVICAFGTLLAENFYWGVAISEYQNSGSKTVNNCNWAEWEKIKGIDSGASNDHFGNYETHIAALEELGCNSFRFSLEWSLIEKEEGVFDEQVLARYHEEIDALIARGITPMVTMHHFTEPLWFTEKGGFENFANIKLFEEFAVRIFKEFHGKVRLWSVINEPAVNALMPYLLGLWPPEKVDVKAGFSVLKHLLIAHVNVYQYCKKIDPDAQIGFVHSFLEFNPYSSWNPVERVASYYMSKMWNEGVMNFFLTGELSLSLPFKAKEEYKDTTAPNSFDFVGVNYYSTPILKLTPFGDEWMEASCYEHETMTDMPYHINPGGFYDTLMKCKQFNKPIYVTENGIADSKDDRRTLFIQTYIDSMFRAMEDGCDVRGYYYWTLFDNFEWSDGFDMKFGLFHFDRESHQFLIKDGGKAYRNVIHSLREEEGKKGERIMGTASSSSMAKLFGKGGNYTDDTPTLYINKNCPYCKKVLRYMKENDLSFRTRDTRWPHNKLYLKTHAPKTQVPCLFLDDGPMYESLDIINYLDQTYAGHNEKKTSAKVAYARKNDPALKLFVHQRCKYCQMVIKFLHANNIQVKYKNMSHSENKQFLKENTGKTQVPCLMVEDEYIFESADIIRFFKEEFDIQ